MINVKSGPRRTKSNGKGASSFPLRAACVDMGSNAIRFFAAEFSSPREWRVLASERVPIRLGHGVFLNGRLSTEAMDGALSALILFATKLRMLKVPLFRMTCTSAVREAANGNAFLKQIQRETGLKGEVISGFEEARLLHLAVKHAIAMGPRPWLIVDVGGGSVEMTLADEAGITWTESHTMGAVRLLEELTVNAESPGRLRRLLEEYISTLNLHSASRLKKPAGLIATGGNIETIADLIGSSRGRGPVRILRKDLRSLIDSLSRLPFARRVKDLGLKPDRADVILPAALVYDRAAALVHAREIRVPRAGLKEGILMDLVDEATAQRSHEERTDRQVWAGAVALGRRYLFDEPHGTHVAALALSLFDQCLPLHGLKGAERRILMAAAVTHDIGTHVSFKKHHKHSYYLISESELPDFTPRQMLLAANVARYHRKAEPAEAHENFAVLADAERRTVEVLAAILRIADALDREHRQKVAGVQARLRARVVELTLEGEGDLLLERWALRRKAGLFEKVFQRDLNIAEGGAS